MDKLTEFRAAIQKEMAVTLATAAAGSVTMRVVSPALYGEQILIFTDRNSRKYRQLEQNPHGALAVGPLFAEADAELCGPCLAEENASLRAAYCAKFPDAFDENVAYGGRDCDFILLRPTRLSGWGFAHEPPAEGEIPSVPFELELA